jgi:hypothetical protein
MAYSDSGLQAQRDIHLKAEEAAARS